MLVIHSFSLFFMIALTLSSTILQSVANNSDNHHHYRKLSTAETKPILEPLEKAKSTLNKLLVLIYQRYEYFDNVTENFMLTSANLNKETWDLVKYKFATKFIKSQIKRLKTFLLKLNKGEHGTGGTTSTSAGTTPSNTTKNTLRYDVDSYDEDISTRFLMIFSGSSVTAGHDSYFNQSFPMIVKSRFQPVFDALGINLVVRNIGQGANPCIPYAFCYESMGGLDPDFLAWEQAYNCGHDGPVFELTERIAQFSRNKAIVYYSASGAWAPSNCPHFQPNTSTPYCAESWSVPADVLAKHKWEPTTAEVKRYRTLYDTYAKAKLSAARFVVDKMYFPFSHGFNVWENNPLCKTTTADGKLQTGCVGVTAAKDCHMKFMSWEAALYGSDSGGGAKHHPTRAFHMLRGESIVWQYGLAMMDMLEMVTADLKAVAVAVSATGRSLHSHSDSDTAGDTHDGYADNSADGYADDTHSTSHTQAEATTHHTTHHQRITRQLITQIDVLTDLEKKYDSVLNGMYANYSITREQPKHCHTNLHCQLRPLCYTNYQPHYSPYTLTSALVGTTEWTRDDESYGDWSLHYGYLDGKPGFSANNITTPISFYISVNKTKHLWLCGGNILETVLYVVPWPGLPIKNLEKLPLIEKQKMQIQLLEKIKQSTGPWEHHTKNAYGCKYVSGLPEGISVISISMNMTFAKTQKAPAVSLSHLITWPY